MGCRELGHGGSWGRRKKKEGRDAGEGEKRKREKGEKKKKKGKKKGEKGEKEKRGRGGRIRPRNGEKGRGWLQKGRGWERKKTRGRIRVWRLGGLGPVWATLSQFSKHFYFAN